MSTLMDKTDRFGAVTSIEKAKQHEPAPNALVLPSDFDQKPRHGVPRYLYGSAPRDAERPPSPSPTPASYSPTKIGEFPKLYTPEQIQKFKHDVAETPAYRKKLVLEHRLENPSAKWEDSIGPGTYELDKPWVREGFTDGASFSTGNRHAWVSKRALSIPGPGSHTIEQDSIAKRAESAKARGQNMKGNIKIESILRPRLLPVRDTVEPGPGHYFTELTKGHSQSPTKKRNRQHFVLERDDDGMGSPGPASYDPVYPSIAKLQTKNTRATGKKIYQQDKWAKSHTNVIEPLLATPQSSVDTSNVTLETAKTFVLESAGPALRLKTPSPLVWKPATAHSPERKLGHKPRSSDKSPTNNNGPDDSKKGNRNAASSSSALNRKGVKDRGNQGKDQQTRYNETVNRQDSRYKPNAAPNRSSSPGVPRGRSRQSQDAGQDTVPAQRLDGAETASTATFNIVAMSKGDSSQEQEQEAEPVGSTNELVDDSEVTKNQKPDTEIEDVRTHNEVEEGRSQSRPGSREYDESQILSTGRSRSDHESRPPTTGSGPRPAAPVLSGSEKADVLSGSEKAEESIQPLIQTNSTEILSTQQGTAMTTHVLSVAETLAVDQSTLATVASSGHDEREGNALPAQPEATPVKAGVLLEREIEPSLHDFMRNEIALKSRLQEEDEKKVLQTEIPIQGASVHEIVSTSETLADIASPDEHVTRRAELVDTMEKAPILLAQDTVVIEEQQRLSETLIEKASIKSKPTKDRSSPSEQDGAFQAAGDTSNETARSGDAEDALPEMPQLAGDKGGVAAVAGMPTTVLPSAALPVAALPEDRIQSNENCIARQARESSTAVENSGQELKTKKSESGVLESADLPPDSSAADKPTPDISISGTIPKALGKEHKVAVSQIVRSSVETATSTVINAQLARKSLEFGASLVTSDPQSTNCLDVNANNIAEPGLSPTEEDPSNPAKVWKEDVLRPSTASNTASHHTDEKAALSQAQPNMPSGDAIDTPVSSSTLAAPSEESTHLSPIKADEQTYWEPAVIGEPTVSVLDEQGNVIPPALKDGNWDTSDYELTTQENTQSQNNQAYSGDATYETEGTQDYQYQNWTVPQNADGTPNDMGGNYEYPETENKEPGAAGITTDDAYLFTSVESAWESFPVTSTEDSYGATLASQECGTDGATAEQQTETQYDEAYPPVDPNQYATGQLAGEYSYYSEGAAVTASFNSDGQLQEQQPAFQGLTENSPSIAADDAYGNYDGAHQQQTNYSGDAANYYYSSSYNNPTEQAQADDVAPYSADSSGGGSNPSGLPTTSAALQQNQDTAEERVGASDTADIYNDEDWDK